MIKEYELPYSILGKIVDKLKVSKDKEKTTERTLLIKIHRIYCGAINRIGAKYCNACGKGLPRLL